MRLVKIGTRSIIPPLEGPFRILFWGHISAPSQDIFTKFGGYVGNGLPEGVEWSKNILAAVHHTCNVSVKFDACVNSGLSKCVEWCKYDSFKNPIWQTATVYHTATYRRSMFLHAISTDILSLRSTTSS